MIITSVIIGWNHRWMEHTAANQDIFQERQDAIIQLVIFRLYFRIIVKQDWSEIESKYHQLNNRALSFL